MRYDVAKPRSKNSPPIQNSPKNSIKWIKEKAKNLTNSKMTLIPMERLMGALTKAYIDGVTTLIFVKEVQLLEKSN